MSDPREDDLTRLERELQEALRAIALLREENERLGGGSVPWRLRGQAPGAALCAHGPAYRSLDRRVQVEDALAEADAAIADMRIENAILRSRSVTRMPWRAAGLGLAGLVGAFGLLALLWLVSESGGLVLFTGVMLALGIALVHLIGGIPPREGGPPPGPPMVPGG